MKRSRFMQERIIGVLKEHQAAAKAVDLRRKHEISDATVYSLAIPAWWHGGVGRAQAEGPEGSAITRSGGPAG